MTDEDASYIETCIINLKNPDLFKKCDFFGFNYKLQSKTNLLKNTYTLCARFFDLRFKDHAERRSHSRTWTPSDSKIDVYTTGADPIWECANK